MQTGEEPKTDKQENLLTEWNVVLWETSLSEAHLTQRDHMDS
jgi:hypothetical protein